MRILVAPNAFKGSLSVLDAAKAIKKGVLSGCPKSAVTLLPISDGGDGLIDALLWSEGGRKRDVLVKGPLGERRRAVFAILPGGEAIVEMARASGLALVAPILRNPLLTTSWGTGDLIAAAARSKARTIIIGMGGSASSDGGAGMARALGVKFLDAKGRELGLGAASLRHLARIDRTRMLKSAQAIKIIAVSDVDNPLLGSRGSARIFGPQKGATPEMVGILEESLSRYAAVIKEEIGLDVAKNPGGGAAGGLGAGLAAFLNAEIVPGAQWVLERLEVQKALAKSDALMTGEGRLDVTSFYGKAPVEMARQAAQRKIPTTFVCGQIDRTVLGKLRPFGVKAAVSFADAGANPKNSISRAKHWAAKAARIAAQGLVPALWLGLIPALAHSTAASDEPASASARVDWLYFHRNEGDNLRQDIAVIDGLFSQHPQDADLLWKKGRALIRVGEDLQSKKAKVEEFQQALNTLTMAVTLHPRDPDAHFWHGVAMGRLGQAQGILHSLFMVKPMRKEMKTILALNPNYGGAYRVLGEMDMQIPRFAGGSVSRGIQELENSVRLSPTETSNYISLAQAYQSIGEKTKAVEILKKVMQITNPNDPAESPDDMKDAQKMLRDLNGGSGASR